MRAIRSDDAAITGRGLVTALGFGLDASFQALLYGTSAVRAVEDADAGDVRSHAAVVAEPYLRTEVPRELVPHIKFLNGAGELSVEAVAEAYGEAALGDAHIDPWIRGLYLSQMDSGDWSCPEFRPAFAAATLRRHICVGCCTTLASRSRSSSLGIWKARDRTTS